MVAASVRASPPVCQDWRLADFPFMFKMTATALSTALSCKAEGGGRQPTCPNRYSLASHWPELCHLTSPGC